MAIMSSLAYVTTSCLVLRWLCGIHWEDLPIKTELHCWYSTWVIQAAGRDTHDEESGHLYGHNVIICLRGTQTRRFHPGLQYKASLFCQCLHWSLVALRVRGDETNKKCTTESITNPRVPPSFLHVWPCAIIDINRATIVKVSLKI